MTDDHLRAACLALDGATETFPFSPGTSVFKNAENKIFAICPLGEEPLEVSLKCEPDRATELRSDYEAIRPGYHLNKRHWVTVGIGGDAPDALVRELIEDSFDLVS